MDMDETGAADSIRKWLDSEKLETREVQDPQNSLHLHVRYPPTKAAHVFNIVIPFLISNLSSLLGLFFE